MTSRAETTSPEALPQAVATALAQVPESARLIVGFSGGLDSHVLLNCLAGSCAARLQHRVLAVHVNHGQQQQSTDWVAHCRQVCVQLDIPYQSHDISEDEHFRRVLHNQGLEAALREARLKVFEQCMQPGDTLLLAHHADDQAELFLMRALRGAGPQGLAGMTARRPFGDGWLIRPLLQFSRDAMTAYAERHQLHFITDPSNEDQQFDRNFVRHTLLPLIRQRWPAATQTLARAASHSQSATELLASLGATDLLGLRTETAAVGQLRIPLLLDLSWDRRNNAIRQWIREQGLSMPSLQVLETLGRDLLGDDKASGVVNAGEYELRRYRDLLYLVAPPVAPVSPFCYTWPSGQEQLGIDEIARILSRRELLESGMQIPDSAVLQVCSRQGGEKIAVERQSTLDGGPPGVIHKSVKKLFQEAGIAPWLRDQYPLIYVDGELAAVCGLAVSATCKKSR